ncbi:hypothetical protein NQ317_005472 [Molorchus minor]|uniref:Prostaglandin reductase 1 n=1 Tax=Molorchus minor TaxID=1323400 RepID=A0ABQ9JWH2_9CUCU|nr:hypothetical protein NQ317_005472 [Molorchus minor]
MVKAKVYIFEKQFDGFPKEDDLKLIEEDLPEIKNGEFLAEAVYLSVDPYMRAYAPRLQTGTTFIGSQVSKDVKELQYSFYKMNPKHKKSGLSRAKILNFLLANTLLVSSVGELIQYPTEFKWTVDLLPLSLTKFWRSSSFFGHRSSRNARAPINICMQNTAYFGLLEVVKPKEGDTLVVTGAGGAVGSLVGQIGKIKGCKVIGILGSDEKGKWLVDELGFDGFINYKTADLNKALKELAPNGINCYFDNVGGEISSTILRHMVRFGRIGVCGCISTYNEKDPKASIVQYPMVFSELRMEGLHVTRWSDRYTEGILQNKKWIEEGKLKYRETVTEGFENMFKAFTGMLKGENFGKAVVKV